MKTTTHPAEKEFPVKYSTDHSRIGARRDNGALKRAAYYWTAAGWVGCDSTAEAWRGYLDYFLSGGAAKAYPVYYLANVGHHIHDGADMLKMAEKLGVALPQIPKDRSAPRRMWEHRITGEIIEHTDSDEWCNYQTDSGSLWTTDDPYGAPSLIGNNG